MLRLAGKFSAEGKINLMSENEYNVENSKIKLLNYLINYLIRNKNRNRYNLTLRIDPQVYEDFKFVCQKLGLLKGTSRGNLVVEAFMQWFTRNFDAPKVVQTTLFYKPKIEKVEVKQEQVNIGVKLPVKIVVRDLEQLLRALEEKRGDHSFYLNKLRRTVEKASKLYNTTRDEQLKVLLERAEKWI